MKKRGIVTYTSEEIRKMRESGQDRTDWKRLEEMRDEDIDYSDIPPLTEEFWENAVLVRPGKKDQISFRVDHDIIEFFQKQGGRGYQTRMHAVLRHYVDSHKKPE